MRTCSTCGKRIAKTSDVDQCRPCFRGERPSGRIVPEDVNALQVGQRVQFVPPRKNSHTTKITGVVIRVSPARVTVRDDAGRERTVGSICCRVLP